MQCYFYSTASLSLIGNTISVRGRRTRRKLFAATHNEVNRCVPNLANLRCFHMERRPSRLLDLYTTGAAAAPIHIFIHGGAWRLLSKRDSSFAAENFVRSGVHFIALDFAQLPSVSLGEMVAQVRHAVAWVYENARKFDGDPAQIHISGHSSGGHLAACVAVTDWTLEFGLPREIVKSVICASGIYDLRPVRLSARNDYVKLDAETEQMLSPIRHLDRLSTSVFLACGSRESDEFKRQSREFAAALGPALALAAPHAELQALNHFEVAETLANPEYGLGLAALNLIGTRGNSA